MNAPWLTKRSSIWQQFCLRRHAAAPLNFTGRCLHSKSGRPTHAPNACTSWHHIALYETLAQDYVVEIIHLIQAPPQNPKPWHRIVQTTPTLDAALTLLETHNPIATAHPNHFLPFSTDNIATGFGHLTLQTACNSLTLHYANLLTDFLYHLARRQNN